MPNTTVIFEPYTNIEVVGVGFLVAAGALSLLTAGCLFLFILFKICTVRDAADGSFFRNPLAVYFACLLFSDVIEGVSSVINASWVTHRGIEQSSLCVAQAALKQAGHLGTAFWSLVIACQTFVVLFYGIRSEKWVTYTTLIGVWLLVLLLMLLGPLAIAKPAHGPFWGIKGSWCWIEDGYPIERHVLQYTYQFVSAFGSMILYTLVVLRIRGNIVVNGWRFSFQRRRPRSKTPDSSTLQPAYYTLHRRQRTHDSHVVTNLSQPNSQVIKVAKHMMLYPIAYMILILPHATTRFMYFAGHSISHLTMICTATLLMLNGFVDTVLFLTTRRVLPAKMLFPRRLRSFLGLSTTEDDDIESKAHISSSRPQMTIHDGTGILVNIERISDSDVPQSPVRAKLHRESLHLHHQHRPLGPYDMLTTTLRDGRDASVGHTRPSLESTCSIQGGDMLMSRKIARPSLHRPNMSTDTGMGTISGTTVVGDGNESRKGSFEIARAARLRGPAVVEFDSPRPQTTESYMPSPTSSPGLEHASVGYQYRVHGHPYASPQATNQHTGRYD